MQTKANERAQHDGQEQTRQVRALPAFPTRRIGPNPASVASRHLARVDPCLDPTFICTTVYYCNTSCSYLMLYLIAVLGLILALGMLTLPRATPFRKW